MRRINILIADRYPVVVQGLRKVLGAERDFKIVACCSDGASCIEGIRNLQPDIAIIDISLPGLTGLEIVNIINSEESPTRVIFFAKSVGDCGLVEAAAAGAYGIILKDVAVEVLVRSLRQIANGQRLLPLPSNDQSSQELSEVAQNGPRVLTERERQIMRLVSEGLSNKVIARRLHITDGTIKVHLHNMFQKLEISNRTELAALAISQNESASSAAERQVVRPRVIRQRRR
jgi:DNA-binding NarL/FixJ family response regulator